MSEAPSSGQRINEAAENLRREYEDISREIQKIKEKINGLELVISQKATSTCDEMGELRIAEERLDELTDRAITRSMRAWEHYRALEQDSNSEVMLEALKDLESLCRRTEELASDLLCYALARFRKGRP